MKRREFLKGLGLMSLWMVSPKTEFKAAQEEKRKEEPEATPEVDYSHVYFTSWCSSSYFQVGCHPGRFSFCDTCRENPKNL